MRILAVGQLCARDKPTESIGVCIHRQGNVALRLQHIPTDTCSGGTEFLARE